MRITRKNIGILSTIILVSVLLCLPQIVTGKMIIGSDIIFHFNRFYDTAMQIRTGIFNYFPSFYGFQASGRVVNAIYGPIVAYLQGALVLLAKTWFNYQVLSNFVLYVVSASSMFLLLFKTSRNKGISLVLALLFVMTFPIQYWVQRQAFTSWGAAILPFTLLPIINLERNKKFDWIYLGAAVSLATQVHVFTSLQVVMIYLIYFGVAFVTASNSQRISLILSVFKSVICFSLLSFNIIYSYLSLNNKNDLAEPWLNPNLQPAGVNAANIQWLLTPIILIVLVIIFYSLSLAYWKKISPQSKVTLVCTTMFLVISTSLFPWDKLVELGLTQLSVVQFPYRFFVPFVVLLFYGISLVVSDLKGLLNYKHLLRILVIGLIISAAQIMHTTFDHLERFNAINNSDYSPQHAIISNNREAVIASLYSTDMSRFLTLWQKPTPDYIPVVDGGPRNRYKAYEKQIINNQKAYDRSVTSLGHLEIKWDAKDVDVAQLPVFKYADTVLKLNGSILSDADYSLTKIGSVNVTSQEGENVLEVYYHYSIMFYLSLIVSAIGWIGVLILFLLRKIKSPEE